MLYDDGICITMLINFKNTTKLNLKQSQRMDTMFNVEQDVETYKTRNERAK